MNRLRTGPLEIAVISHLKCIFELLLVLLLRRFISSRKGQHLAVGAPRRQAHSRLGVGQLDGVATRHWQQENLWLCARILRYIGDPVAIR